MQQQPQQHQMMGYDRAITMFSPDGRLLQVEYAKKTVRQGSTAIGVVCKDGVILVADKRIMDPLIVPEAVEKVWQIDDHIATTAAGIVSDARVLVERAQIKAQQHKVTYDNPIDTLSIVKDICDLKQVTTQSGGYRPFGVSLIIGGIDEDGPKLFETDPTGIFFQYKATAIGEGETEVEEILHKEYKDSLTIDDAFKLCLRALYKFVGDDLNVDRIEAVYIRSDDRKYVKMDKKDVDKALKEVKKK